MRRGSTARTVSQLSRRRLLAPPNRLAVINRRRRWVLQLWEAFLIQMDDFDRLIEFQLRRRLDVLVAAPVPVRRGQAGASRSSKRRPGTEATKRVGMTELGGALVLLEHS
ncbi:MAG: hypothetical protein QOI23_343 [Chloroflexota bacterium]|nr:hypothetical protein [Chloroflexota bacterium]